LFFFVFIGPKRYSLPISVAAEVQWLCLLFFSKNKVPHPKALGGVRMAAPIIGVIKSRSHFLRENQAQSSQMK
jgi:hypothetical protein